MIISTSHSGKRRAENVKQLAQVVLLGGGGAGIRTQDLCLSL